ncbi:hypothetical protein [Streptomyces justiciae]|uniref:Aromatic ring-opening dioxygenase LigA n=1 Tax=Streptomyces justiciae TaxID=2780140 RepID=A0ABU3LS97_9ACTN|nr:hypothetical protein [Streptomyces justiciae]MDT7841488.1 hypothetical protein [Streptomyces justiciae]
MSGPPEPSGSAPAPKDTGPADGVGGHGSRAGRIARSTASAVLIVLTCVLVPVALLTVWVHDIALDTDRYVATVKPLATDPAIQDAAVRRISEAADVRVDGDQAAADIATWLTSQGLPPRAAAAVRNLGPQLDSAVDNTVTKVATRFVEGDRFEKVWTNANRAAHNTVVHALTGEGRGAVGVSGGTVTLDVGTAVDRVRQELVDAGLSPAAKIPDVDKEMVLFHSDQLGKIRKGAHLLDVIGDWFPVLVVALGAAGVLLAHRRRRALARTALGAAFACLVVAIVLVVARRYYLDHLPPQIQSRAAAAAVFDTLLHFLRVSLRTAIVLGVVIALGTYLIGPGRLPVAVRRTSERTADSAATWAYGHQVRTGRAGTWTHDHRRWITLAALLIVALAFALWNHPTALTILLLVLVLLAVLALVALLAATGRATLAAGQGAPVGRNDSSGDRP